MHVAISTDGQRVANFDDLLRLAVLAVAAWIAVSSAASAQSPSPAPGAALPPPPAPQLAAASSLDAPEPWRTDRFYIETSIYTRHFHYDPAHDDHQHLILADWNITEHWLVGASAFDNSFNQPSQYVYGAYRFRPFARQQPLYFKLSAGFVHGYTGKYRNNIPFNGAGIAPAILPSVGYCLNRFCSELVLFGIAGTLVTFGISIP
jgi:hypothetical protein